MNDDSELMLLHKLFSCMNELSEIVNNLTILLKKDIDNESI